jgi:diguanylate cyclase (GGDEF)-like protein/PAS domain S-box-containing protein
VHRSLPGVLLQALAYQSTYGKTLQRLTPQFEHASLLALLVVYCGLVGRQKWRVQLVYSLLLCAGILLLSELMFRELRLILPAVFLVTGVALAQTVTWLDNLDRQTLDLIRQKLLLRKRTAMMRAIVENSMDAILAIGARGKISDANPAAARLFGHTQQELHGRAVEELLPHWAKLSSGDPARGGAARVQSAARLSDGSLLPVELSLGQAWLGDESNHFVFLHDITRQLEYERELEYRAGHDSLTGLANRRSMERSLSESVAQARTAGTPVSFMLVDLNHFKEINDTLGHPTGDRVLLRVAARMSEYCRCKCAVARIGGDEFGVLFEGGGDVAQFAEGLLASIRKPLALDEMTIEVSASIGISVFPDDAQDDTALVQHADVAMYLAKELVCGYRRYDAAADRHSLRRLGIIAQLREAISQKQLYLVYQPKVSLTDRRLAGAEALIRWRHPDLGNISPAEFIPIAEQVGLIDSITLWLIDEVLGYIRSHRHCFDGLSIAINISARSLVDPQFPGVVLSRIDRAGIDPARLALEVTETAVIREPDTALDVLKRLSDAGIAIEIDDFGTGYSSLSYLSRFPARRLKIDRSFIAGMLASTTDRSIVAASVELAHRLGMQTVAEGVEDEETFSELSRMGCDYAQGYGISKPLAAADFTARAVQAGGPVREPTVG